MATLIDAVSELRQSIADVDSQKEGRLIICHYICMLVIIDKELTY